MVGLGRLMGDTGLKRPGGVVGSAYATGCRAEGNATHKGWRYGVGAVGGMNGTRG